MNTYWQRLTASFCFLFGLALIANTLTAADGVWYWYAWYLQQGKRLYADMQLAMQPLFVLEAEFFLALLGKGWIVSKIPAVLNLLGFCLGIFLLSRQSRWKDYQKAILIACAFFVCLRSVFYRFDDYHIPADCLFLFSLLLLLLMLEKDSSFRRNTCLAAGLGVLSGLTFVLRLNDGAALISAVAIIILCVAPGRKLALLAVYGLAIALTIETIVLFSGDTFRSYAMNSIFHAAGAKGGVASLLAYPFLTPGKAVRVFIEEPWIVGTDFAILAAAFSWTFLLRPFSRKNLRSTAPKAALGLLVIGIAFQQHLHTLILRDPILALLPVWVLVVYGLSLAAVIRFFLSRFTHGQSVAWNSREILLLVPLAMVASLSMTSAGHYYNSYPPCAVMILLLPIASPIRLHEGWRRSTFLAVAVIMSLSGFVSKGLHPVSWLSYWSGPVFRHRQIFHHPVYGPMLIEEPLLHYIQPVCEQIRKGPPQPELLSMPYSFGNYFCVIPPWHGYVQTFFDTSTQATISRLMDELESSPPLWILYQRQLPVLAIHEEIFQGGQRLPHRDLDELIMRKIDQGEWLVADRRGYLEDSDWILLRTRK